MDCSHFVCHFVFITKRENIKCYIGFSPECSVLSDILYSNNLTTFTARAFADLFQSMTALHGCSAIHYRRINGADTQTMHTWVTLTFYHSNTKLWKIVDPVVFKSLQQVGKVLSLRMFVLFGSTMLSTWLYFVLIEFIWLKSSSFQNAENNQTSLS